MANKLSKFTFVLLTSCSFLTRRIYKTIHRPPYETVKTEDLSSNFLSLQEIQSAYCKFKQLFLIGERMLSKISVKWTWGKQMMVTGAVGSRVTVKQSEAGG